MYLKRVTITGFKSFAGKTVLNLERGITGVVGPNGSGKSNLADAVRWALGEQNKTRLRLGDKEGVVFAGTATRPKASYAEVILLFDNESGAFPLDLTEVEISRRLYRSGESDYRLAGRSVALRDIQALLAQAGFGAGSYAVIGQGMIDSFLLSSPSERKLLFDEAAGIRGPELGREAAMRKLNATSANLTRLRDIAAELSPRLSSLQRSLAAEDEQRALAAKVEELRRLVVASSVGHWSRACEDLTGRLAQVTMSAHRLSHQQADAHRRLTAVQAKAARLQERREALQTQLSHTERQRDELSQQLGDLRAQATEMRRLKDQITAQATEIRHLRTDLASAEGRVAEIKSELADNIEAAARAKKAVDKAAREASEAQAALVAIRKGTDEGTRDQYITHALEMLRTLATGLDDEEEPISAQQVRLLVHKAGRLLSHARRTGTREILDQLAEAQKRLEAAMGKREIAIEHQTNITITRRSLEIDLTHQNETVQSLRNQASQVEHELASAQATVAGLGKNQDETQHVAAELESISELLEQQRDQLRAVTATTVDTRREVELAATVERLKASVQTADSSRAVLKESLEEAKKSLGQARRQAEEWGITPADRTVRQPLDQLRSELVRTEVLLEARQAAHRENVSEYEEVQGRYADLTTQIADLESAGADLEHVIAELDELIKVRFKENFEQLAAQFSTYFHRLFNGGTAALELQTADDGTYGIAIKASPAGKRPVSLAALSGGERALAGVALLAAILRVNPSPFVVMDEIDAALDEANSGRLAGILGELSEHSQLIVITHNRQTMQAARVLFGVAPSEHQTSRLLSMRLEEATQLAAR